MTSRELTQKATIAVGDLTTNGGALNPEQSDTFIRKLQKQPTILRQARVVPMGTPQMKINKIGFGSSILRAATNPGTGPDYTDRALAATARSKPTTEQITLTTKEVIAEVRIPYEVIEDVIERGNINALGGSSMPGAVGGQFKDTIMDLIAERAALDLEDLALNGVSGFVDVSDANRQSFMRLNDGYLALAASTYNHNFVGQFSRAAAKEALKTMPSQYQRNLSALRYFTSVNQEINYRDSLAERETLLGDGGITGFNPVYAFGIPVERTPLMPEATALLTHPLNFIFGIQRNISVEVDKSITERVFIIVLTSRIDFKVEETAALIKISNLAS